jgi:4-hydroxy-tetrahydrodipicolinate synthase
MAAYCRLFASPPEEQNAVTTPQTLHRRMTVPIVPTPFDASYSLLIADIPRLVDYYQGCGSDGMTILGVMGEAQKLSPSEIRLCVTEFTRRARGRMPIIVGVSNASLAASAEFATMAVGEGAAAAMLTPISGIASDSGVVSFFERFVEATKGAVPVCVQDDPRSSNVHMSLAAWRRISQLKPIIMLKHEPIPGLQPLSEIIQAQEDGSARRVILMTSANAAALPQELARGADGPMSGVAYSDAIAQICRLFWSGESDRAFDLHDALLPLIQHETGAFGLAIRKEILRRRGALTTNVVRYPGATLSAYDLTELDRLVARFERRLRELDIVLPLNLTTA